MSDHLGKQENLDLWSEKYARPPRDAVHEIGRAVLGHECGLNAYTTAEQAKILVERLALTAKSRLLDVGAGYGWPGFHLAESCDCALVATDVPVEALREVKRHLAQASAVSADGRALPFRSSAFDAVVHADVFC